MRRLLESPRAPASLAAEKTSVGTFVAVAVVVALAAHASALSNDYVNYDDPEVRAQIARPWPFAFWTEATYYAYKPVYFTALWLERLAFGDGATGPHVVSWLLFAACAGLAVAVVAALARSAWIGGAVGILLAVHPVHAENVAWMSEQKDVLSLFLVLLAHLAYRRSRERAGRRRPWGAAVLFALAGLTKGTVWTYAGVLALDEHLDRDRPAGVARRLLPIVAIAVLGIGLDAWIGTETGPASVEHDATTLQLVAAMAGVHLRYLVHLVWPVGLSVDYAISPRGSFTDPWTIGGLALTVLVLAALVRGLRRRAWLPALAAGIWVLGLGPVNNVFPKTTTLFADRYLIVPALGAYLAFAAWLSRPGLVRARGTVLALLAIALGLAAAFRGRVYADSETMWSDAIDAQPKSALAWINRGRARGERGLWTAAEADAVRGIEAASSGLAGSGGSGASGGRPEHVLRGWLLRSQALLAMGRFPEALAAANAAATTARGLTDLPWVRGDPSEMIAAAETDRGTALAGMSDPASAATAYRSALKASPGSWEALYGLGNLLAGVGSPATWNEAEDVLRRAHRADPTHLDTVIAWVGVLFNLQRRDEAARALDEAFARHGRSNRDLLLLRAKINGEGTIDVARAEADYRTVLVLHPGDPEARRGLANLYRSAGRGRMEAARTSSDKAPLREALASFEKAVQVDATDAEALWLAGDALFQLERFREARGRYREAAAADPSKRWLKSQEARAGVWEAVALLERGKDAEAVSVMAAVVRASPPRIDLGFQALDGELPLLVPAAEAVEHDESKDRPVATLVLACVARLAAGDEKAAGAAADLAIGAQGTAPAKGSRAESLLGAAHLLRGILRARRADPQAMDGARTDYEAAARYGADERLVTHHVLLLDRLRATAMRRMLGAAEAPEKQKAAVEALARVVEGAHRLADASPPWPGPTLLSAELDLERGDTVGALSRLNAAAERFPGDPSVYRGIAAVYVTQALAGPDAHRLLPQARAALRAATALDPRDSLVALDMSQVCQLEGDLSGAMKYAVLAASFAPVPGAAARRVAALFVDGGRKSLEQRDWEKLAGTIRAARMADPKAAAPDVLEGDQWMARKDYEKALTAYQAALEKEPSSPEAMHAMAECRRKRGFTIYMWCLERPKPVAKDGVPPDPKKLSDWEKAVLPRARMGIAELDESLRLEPDGEDAKHAREWRARLAAVDPESQAKALAEAKKHYEDGEVLRRAGNVEDALAEYRAAAAAYPDHLPARVRIAETLISMGKDDDAVQALDDASELDGDYRFPALDLYRGQVQTRRWKSSKDADVARLAREALTRFLASPGGAADAEGSAVARKLLDVLPPEPK